VSFTEPGSTDIFCKNSIDGNGRATFGVETGTSGNYLAEELIGRIFPGIWDE
jgi:hypothetical protein